MNRRVNSSRSGSALIMVLGVVVLLAVLIAGLGYELRGDLQATGSFYEQAQNLQLARSALALAEQEVGRNKAALYADQFGNACFVLEEENYESEIEELLLYRSGWEMGRGQLAYRLIVKHFALDVNDLSETEWWRLFDVACGLDEGDERDALVDAILDWRDSDDVAREFGAEGEHYEALDPPRYVRNDDFETIEELLLVEGMTPELLFGTGSPVTIEDGMLFGGGLYRFLIGDNSPEAQASVKYIQRGILPSEDEDEEEDEELEEGEFEKLDPLPDTLYLVAEGVMAEPPVDDEAEPQVLSRHIILARLVLSGESDSTEYVIEDLQENAAGELLEQVLAFGVPEEI